MKIYTKTGDKGETSLLGGSRVAKDHLRIEAYGTVDELNAWVGHIRSLKSSAVEDSFLVQIQSNLFAIGSALAAEKKDLSFPLPELPEESVEQLEEAIDRMNESCRNCEILSCREVKSPSPVPTWPGRSAVVRSVGWLP